MEETLNNMAYQIQKRRDTAANWTSNNPVLAQGEEGIETDTKKSKLTKRDIAINQLIEQGLSHEDALNQMISDLTEHIEENK